MDEAENSDYIQEDSSESSYQFSPKPIRKSTFTYKISVRKDLKKMVKFPLALK